MANHRPELAGGVQLYEFLPRRADQFRPRREENTEIQGTARSRPRKERVYLDARGFSAGDSSDHDPAQRRKRLHGFREEPPADCFYGYVSTSAVVFVGFALRGRAFGPLIPLAPGRDRSTAEYASAVGNLLRRAGGRGLTLQALGSAARRALAERVGLTSRLQTPDFSAVLSQRAPEAGRELDAAERDMRAGVRSERSLLDIARRLHVIAYPTATAPENKERS